MAFEAVAVKTLENQLWYIHDFLTGHAMYLFPGAFDVFEYHDSWLQKPPPPPQKWREWVLSQIILYVISVPLYQICVLVLKCIHGEDRVCPVALISPHAEESKFEISSPRTTIILALSATVWRVLLVRTIDSSCKPSASKEVGDLTALFAGSLITAWSLRVSLETARRQ